MYIISRKTNFHVVCAKKIKFGAKNDFHETFFAGATKTTGRENLRRHIKY
jgi:hypothetical protein